MEWTISQLTEKVKTAERWDTSPIPRYEDEVFWNGLNRRSAVMRHILDRAEREKAEPIPVLTATEFMGFARTGLREPYHPKMKRRRDRLALFAAAECLRRNGEYIGVLTDEIWAICEESSWIAPAHVRVHGDGQKEESLPSPHHDGFDLLVAMTAQSLAEVLYMMEERLHPYVAERIRYELERRVFRPARDKEYKWFYYGSNWTAVCTGGTVGAALLAERDPERLKRLLDKMLPFLLDTYVGGFTEDGGCSEGILCWNLGFKHFTYAVDLLEHAADGPWNAFERDKVKKICRFPCETYMRNGNFPTFSEPPEHFLPHPWLIDYLAERLQDRELEALIRDLEPHYDLDRVINPDECFTYDLMRLLAWYEAKYDTDARFGFGRETDSGDPGDARPVVAEREVRNPSARSDQAGPSDQVPFSSREDSADQAASAGQVDFSDQVDFSGRVASSGRREVRYLPDLGWLVLPSESGMSIAAKAGHNAEMHNHNDLGNVIAFSPSGDALLADLGKGRMTRAFFIHASRYSILEASSRGHNVPRINGFEQSYGPQYHAVWEAPEQDGERIIWAIELSRAYPEEAGLRRLTRTLEVESGVEHRFRLQDDYAFQSEAGRYENALYTYADHIEPEGDGRVRLSFASGYGLSIRFDAESWTLAVEDAGGEVTRERPYPVRRLLWKPVRPLLSGVWAMEAEMFGSGAR